jgi:hypothetical protein
MKTPLVSVLSFALLFSFSPAAISCPPPTCKELDPTKRPAGRPWTVRYFIYVDDFESTKIGKMVAEKIIEEERKNSKFRAVRPFKHLFTPALAVYLPPVGFSVQELGIVQIEFDRDGMVTTENTSDQRLQGVIDDGKYLVLETEKPADGPPFYIADWFRGWSDPMREFTPAFCTVDDDRRYRKGFDAAKYSDIGNFGCREWSFQLLDRNRPYIDVTSYERNETFIKKFYGWAPFDGPRKPVIGRHYKSWVCLLDCPQGAAPGIIADIAKWVKENGYPIPKRPKKNPMFPNADFPYDYDE